MHKNDVHALLFRTNTAGISRIVAALNCVINTAPKTAQRFGEPYAQSQYYFSHTSLCLCGSMVNGLFAPIPLIHAELHYRGASAASAANFSRVPAVVLQ